MSIVQFPFSNEDFFLFFLTSHYLLECFKNMTAKFTNRFQLIPAASWDTCLGVVDVVDSWILLYLDSVPCRYY